jgi:hypothetical protein
MVALGRANSRMKDFYDIWILPTTFHFAEDRLARAISATFARRQTEIPTETPDALTSAFAEDPLKQRQWTPFSANLHGAPKQLGIVTGDLTSFLMNVAVAARNYESQSL